MIKSLKTVNDYRHRMGARLRSTREKIGETQSQFAQRLNVIGLSVHKYEAGVTCPTAEQLHNLELTGVDATYIAFGHPSLANADSRKNFAAVFSLLKRESQMASLKISDEYLVEGAWFLFCKLSDTADSDRDATGDQVKVVLKYFDEIAHDHR